MLLREFVPALRHGAKILPGDITGEEAMGGNVYYVVSPRSVFYSQFMAERQVVYADGSSAVQSTIQAAVDATVAYRGDRIYVMPKYDYADRTRKDDKWCEQVVIANKDCISIIGVSQGGWVFQMRPSDAVSKGYTAYPFTTKKGTSIGGATFNVLSKNVEIAGFLFDCGGGYAGVYAGGGLNGGVAGYTTQTCHSLWIHHNVFRGADGGSSLYLNGIKSHGVIEDNIFTQAVVANIEMDAGNASNEFTVIRRNEFMAANASYGIYIYGEANSALQCLIRENTFKDGVSKAFTDGILNSTGSTGVVAVVGNWFATAKPMALTAADIVSGNHYYHAGSATEASNYFVQETAAGA